VWFVCECRRGEVGLLLTGRFCGGASDHRQHNELCSAISAHRRPHLQPTPDDLAFFARNLVLAVTRADVQRVCAPPPSRLDLDPRIPGDLVPDVLFIAECMQTYGWVLALPHLSLAEVRRRGVFPNSLCPC
jgi:hypothetical protein